jgi:arginine decarboxylase
MVERSVANGSSASLSRHRSVWELRADGWIGLVDDLGRLATLPREHREWEPRMSRVRHTVAALAPIESYWA